MAAANAWLLSFGKGLTAAIGERELFHILYRPVSYILPRAPEHCARVVEWEGQLLPLWDTRRRLGESRAADVAMVAVVGYQDAAGRTAFGALYIGAPPQRVKADDAEACELPEERPAWREISKSCFTRGGVPVPVLDLATLFAARTC